MSAFRNVTWELPASGSSLVWLLSKLSIKLVGDSLTRFAPCFLFLFGSVIKITNDVMHKVVSHSGAVLRRKQLDSRNTKIRHGEAGMLKWAGKFFIMFCIMPTTSSNFQTVTYK